MRPLELKKGFNCCGVYSRTRTRDADHPRPGRPGTTQPGEAEWQTRVAAAEQAMLGLSKEQKACRAAAAGGGGHQAA